MPTVIRNGLRLLLSCVFVSSAVAQTAIDTPTASSRIPPATRKHHEGPKNGNLEARGQRVRDAANRLGLKGIRASGSFDVPSALYGAAGSGRVPGSSASETARNFLQPFAPVYGLSPADIADIGVTERPGFVSGNREVIIEQRVAGRKLYGAGLRLHLGPNGEFIAAVGDLYGNLRWAGNATLGAAEAIRRATTWVDRVVPPQGAGPVRGAQADEARVSDVAYPDGDEARPAFLCESVTASNGIDMFDVVIDGISGAILEVRSLTAYSQGQVFRNGSLMPTSPQPSLTPGVTPPIPNPPAYVSPIPIAFDSFLTGTTLSGSFANVREYQSWTGQVRSASSGNAISAGAGGDFLFPLNIPISSSPFDDIRNYPKASGTNLFYLLNYLHDYFYALGFDEAHGNFQVDNGILGGVGNDPVIGFVQQGAGTAGTTGYSWNNANMVTPSDGQSPLMAMYVFDPVGTSPARYFLADSALDPDVVFHEFTHGVTARLDHGALPGAAQPGAFNEGNSDFFALNIQVPSSAPVNGAYPVGSYSVQDFTYGIRNYPYSTDMLVNPLTYGNLAYLYGYPEVHNDGEIWASVLWQMRGELINALGFDTGRTRAAQLDIDALQLLPSNASYVDFRNAILSADAARYGGADTTQIWQAFALRGMGALADGGFDGLSLHVLPDASTPGTAARVKLWESAFIAGETIRVLVDDTNAAASTVTLTTSSGDSEQMSLSTDGPVWSGSIATTNSNSPVIHDGVLQLAAGDVITATTTDANTGGGTPTLVTTAAAHAPYSVTLTTNAFDASASTSLFGQGDERTFYYDMPFSFPFFGQSYSRVYVNDNGQIAFGFAPFIRQRGIGGQGTPPSIAPFSVDLDCTGANAMYYHSAADRFTLRWACIEYGHPSNAVNVAVNLFPDGSIRFDYGAGNVLIGNDFYTGLADLATVGLARGTETFAQSVPGYDQSPNLGSVQSVLFTPVADQNIASCPAIFTDPTLTAGVTTIKAAHFTETRTCINALRALAGLPHYSFTPASISGAVTAAVITDMRAALDPALSMLGRAPVSYGRSTLNAGMTILASDLEEIRHAVK